MRRSLLFLLLAAASCFVSAQAADPFQSIEVETSLSGFDLQSALAMTNRATLRPPAVQLPLTTLKGGEAGTIQRIREIRHATDFDANGKASAFQTTMVGAFIRLKVIPTRDSIQYSGNLTLSCAADYSPQTTLIPTFRGSRKWFSGTARLGEPAIVKTYSPEGMPVQLKLTFNLPGAKPKPSPQPFVVNGPTITAPTSKKLPPQKQLPKMLPPTQ